MKKCMLRSFVFVFALFLASTTYAQNNGCKNPQAVLSASIATTTATTTRIINNPDSNTPALLSVVVCSYTITIEGSATANSVQFEYGTGSTCGTGTTTVMGAIQGSTTAGSSTPVTSGDGPLMKLPAGNHFCVVTTQANKVNGHVTYILQN